MSQFILESARSSGKPVISVGLLLAASLLGISQCAAAELYYAREFLEDPSCVYNTNEAFVLIGRTKTVEIVGASEIVWGILGQATGNREIVAQDLIVCHLTNDQARTYQLNQFGHRGSAYFFKGALYFGRADVPGAGVLLWRWSETNFVRVSESEAVSIRGQFRYTSDLMAAEGWGEIPCVSFGSYAGTGDKRPFELSNLRLWLAAKQVGGFSGKSSVSILGLNGNGSELPIVVLDQGLKRITKKTFESLRNRKVHIPGAW